MDDHCEGCRNQLFRGILSHNQRGREYPRARIERCDLCERYGSDEVARDTFDLLMWVQAVIDSEDDPNGNISCMALAFESLTND